MAYCKFIIRTICFSALMTAINTEGSGNYDVIPEIFPEDCCRDNIGDSDGTECGQEACPNVFGFAQPSVSEFERGEPYAMNIGFLSGNIIDEYIEIDVNLNFGTASHEDISLPSSRVRIYPGQHESAVVVLLLLDGVAQEEEETFFLSIAEHSLESLHSMLGNSTTIVSVMNGTIRDSDIVTFVFSANNFFGEEGTNTSIDLIIVKEQKVRLANPVTIRIIPLVGDALENGVIVNFDDEDHLSPTRATGGSDYNETIFEVTFPADEGEEFSINEITAGIQIIDDDIDENLKQHFVVIMEVAGAVNMDLISDTVENVTMCTIVDNDDIKIGFTQAAYTFPEPDATTSFLNVTLIKEVGRVSERTFSVGISLTEPSNISAASILSRNHDHSSDFSFGIPDQVYFNITFPPNLQEVSLNLTLSADDFPEKVEGIKISCTSMEGFPTFKLPETESVHHSAEIQVTDNDFAVVGFEQQRYTFSEASGTGEVCMRVFNPPRNEELVFSILLEYQTILNSADGADFTAVHGSSNFSVSFGSQNIERVNCFTFSIIDDEVHEATESFAFTLHLVDPSRVTLQPNVTQIFISNDDDAEIRFEQTHYTINEGDNSLEVCTLLINPPNNETLAMDIDFDATTSSASADKRDFEHTRETLRFRAGPGSPMVIRRQCFTIHVIDDNSHEEMESFTIRLTARGSGISFVPGDSAEIVILDNDAIQIPSQPSTNNPTVKNNEKSPTSALSIGEIAGIVGGCIALFLVITCVCCICKKKSGKKVQPTAKSDPV